MTAASPEEITRLAGRYAVHMHWSDEDRAYLVTLPEWANDVDMPATHGETREEALKNAREVLEMLVESDLQHGRPLPTPHLFA